MQSDEPCIKYLNTRKICFLGYVCDNLDATNVILDFHRVPKHLTNFVPYFKRIWHFSLLVSSNVHGRLAYSRSAATSSSARINSFAAQDHAPLLCTGREKYCIQLKPHGE